MQRGSIRDQHIDYVHKRVFVRPQDVITGQVTGLSTVLDLTANAGAAILTEMGTSGIMGVRLEATTDEIAYYWVPENFDPSHRVLIRHLWTSDYAIANGTATFTTLYTNHTVGSALAIGATALTKPHAVGTKVSATAQACYWSPYGWIKGNTFGDTTLGVAFLITCGAVSGITIATDYVYWLGMEIVYTPKYTFGDGSRREARLLYSSLSSQEAGAASDV